jgi:hypothetical protein
VKGYKKILLANGNQKEAEIATLLLHKIELHPKLSQKIQFLCNDKGNSSSKRYNSSKHICIQN